MATLQAFGARSIVRVLRVEDVEPETTQGLPQPSRYRMRITAALAALLFAFAAHAQNTITFTAQTTTGDGSVVPALTWSTAPPATSCAATGDPAWTGPKAASGTQTLAAITSSATYNLACTWAADNKATLTWTAPTKNTDGSNLTDLASFRAYWGTVAGVWPNQAPVPGGASATTFVVTPLTPATWNFTVTAVNAAGKESAMAAAVQKTITATGPSQSKTVGIVVNPVPLAVTGLAVQ